MAKVEVKDLNAQKVRDITLNDSVWGKEVHEDALKKMIRLQLAATRQGTHKTKNRSEVSGGGRKPWQQKGTGHARQGSIRSVQWVGGGRYGTPVPRDYSKKQNRKERRLALKSALATVANEKRLIVIDELNFATPKTKEMLAVLKSLKIEDKKDLIVVKTLEENTILASRNLQNVMVMEPSEINVLDLVNADYLVVTEEALKAIEEVLA